MEEIWKSVPNYEGYYEVSNTGKVKSLTRIITYKDGQVHTHIGKELVPYLNSEGYYTVTLHKEGTKRIFKIHRLVALVFISNPDNLPIVNHKDENKLNNNMNNLEWCTSEYNNTYGTRLERVSQSKKHNPKQHPVLMYDKNTHELIKEFPNPFIASKELGISNSNIYAVLNGKRKSASGYLWEYKN